MFTVPDKNRPGLTCSLPYVPHSTLNTLTCNTLEILGKSTYSAKFTIVIYTVYAKTLVLVRGKNFHQSEAGLISPIRGRLIWPNQRVAYLAQSEAGLFGPIRSDYTVYDDAPQTLQTYTAGWCYPDLSVKRSNNKMSEQNHFVDPVVVNVISTSQKQDNKL